MRHSGVTRLARTPNIKESDLVKIGGWRNNKMLHQVYKNTTQDEAFDDVMLGLGIDTRSEDKKRRQKLVDEQLKGIFCPNCAMENLRDTKFCSQCSFVLTAEEADHIAKETEEDIVKRVTREIEEKYNQRDKEAYAGMREIKLKIIKNQQQVAELKEYIKKSLIAAKSRQR